MSTPLPPIGFYGFFSRRAFESSDACMVELTDIILRIQHEAQDPTTLTTFLE